MPGRNRGSSKAENQMLEFETLNVLSESPIALTIEEICEKSMTLHGRSSQKMARVLSELNKMGLVRKAQSRSRKKMMYRAVSQLEEQGITLSTE